MEIMLGFIAGILALLLVAWIVTTPLRRRVATAEAMNKRATALLQTGDIYRDRGASQEAVECYEEAVRISKEVKKLLGTHESEER